MARQRAIQNIPLETTKEVLEAPTDQYSLDFYNSDNLAEVENGIKDVQTGILTSHLAVSLGIANIDRKALYIQAGYKTYTKYFKEADIKLNMPKQTISDYKKIGEAYLRNRSELKRIGFQREGNLHKLRFLDQALQKHDPDEVFKRFKSESFRKFKEYAEESERSDSITRVPQDYTISTTKDRISLDGNPVLSFDPELPELERKGVSAAVREYYRTFKRNLRTVVFDVDSEDEEKETTKYLKRIFKIKGDGDTPCILSVYDEGEGKAVKRKVSIFLKEYRGRK